MRVSVVEVIYLKDGPHKFCIAFEQLVEHLTVIDVVASHSAAWRQWSIQELRLLDRLNMDALVEGVFRRCMEIVGQVTHGLLKVLIAFVKEVLLSATLSVVPRWDEQRIVLFQVSERVENLSKLHTAHFFLLLLSRLGEGTISVAHQWGAWSASKVCIDAHPLRFKLGLDQFQTVQGTHIICGSRQRLISRCTACSIPAIRIRWILVCDLSVSGMSSWCMLRASHRVLCARSWLLSRALHGRLVCSVWCLATSWGRVLGVSGVDRRVLHRASAFSLLLLHVLFNGLLINDHEGNRAL